MTLDEKIRPLMMEFHSDPDFMAGSHNLIVRACTILGKSSFRDSENLTFEFEGLYPAEDLAWNSKDVKINGGKFAGKYAFGRTEHAAADGGEFEGAKAFAHSHYAVLNGGSYTGSSLLDTSRSAIVTAKEINSPKAFENAANLACYSDHISEIYKPRSGIIVAEKIDWLTDPGNAHVFAVEVDHGSQYATKISKAFFKKGVNRNNVMQSIGDILKIYGNEDASKVFAHLPTRDYMRAVDQEEADDAAYRKRKVMRDFYAIANEYPGVKNEWELLFDFKRMKKEKEVNSKLGPFLELHEKELRSALESYGEPAKLELKALDIWREKYAERMSMRFSAYVLAAITAVTLPFALPYIQRMNPANPENVIENVRESMTGHNYQEAREQIKSYLDRNFISRDFKYANELNMYQAQLDSN